MTVGNLKFHHIGIACRDLDREAEMFSVLGYSRVGEDFDDPLQKVRGRFLSGPGPRIELLIQHENADVLEPWLAKGTKMYHLAYETGDLKTEIRRFQRDGAKLIVPPTPAVAFDGREICFFVLPTLLLVELIQEEVIHTL